MKKLDLKDIRSLIIERIQLREEAKEKVKKTMPKKVKAKKEVKGDKVKVDTKDFDDFTAKLTSELTPEYVEQIKAKIQKSGVGSSEKFFIDQMNASKPNGFAGFITAYTLIASSMISALERGDEKMLQDENAFKKKKKTE